MPLTIDQDDTQVLEFDSPHSGSGDVFLGGETLPPDYGETQRVDSCDDQLGVGFEGWGKTQVIDEFEETEVVRDDDEDEGGQSERTELVADEEGLVDDFVGEVSSGVRTKVADLVDPDASTDEEGGCGHDEAEECSRKSYVALPVAAPQSSGFANVCSMTCIPIGKNSALNTAGSKKDEIIFDPDADNSFKFVEGYGRDHHPYQEEETEIRSELNKEKLSSLSPLRCSQDAAAAAGLSYISSQEPGAQSQAMALGVVDKFLSVNNEGLSPGINKENTDKSISLPIASVKRAQCFVRKTDKNTERKVQVFDWIDSLEDDGGGGLFSRRKSSFDCKGSKQVSRTCQKLASLEKSKNLFDELKERTNTDTMEQLQKSDVDISDEGVYNCGPATQMAAEAMQALGRSSHVNFELSSGGEVISRTCSRNSSTRKRSNRSKGIKTRLKPQNIPKSSTKSCNSSRKQSTMLRTKMVSEDSTADITKKSDGNCAVISVDNGKYASSIIGETMKNMLDKEVEKPTVPMILCKQPSVGAKCVIGASEMYTSPVAHRTRRSKAAELLNVNKTLSNDPCKITSRINSRARRTTEVEDDFFSNASAAPKANKNGCNISLTGTIGLPDAVEMERVHVEEAEAAHDSDADRESKRRKTNNHSKSDDPIAPTIANPAIQKKKRKVFIRSFAEILDTVKRRRRSVSSSNKLESDGMPSNSRKMRNESGIRTRSSLLSDILKPYFACKAASDGTANTYSVSSVKQVADNGGLETSKESAQSRLHAEVKNTSQCGLRCSPTTSRNAVSPVCNSQGASRLSFHKSSSRSPISRELIRLEASYTSPSKLNDVRRRKDMACFQICFSNHLSQDVIKQQKKILKRLGIQDVSTSLEATHFVADRFVRTRNMLEAMAMGKPVVTPMWLESCGQASSSIDEKNYILRDAKKEKEIGFSMPVSLARAGQHPLLQGKRVLVTRNARPNRELISSLVKVAGGQPLKRIELSITEEDELPDDLLILSAEEDYAVCAPLLEKGAVVFSSELLLNGIVIQKLEFERHHLFLNQVTR